MCMHQDCTGRKVGIYLKTYLSGDSIIGYPWCYIDIYEMKEERGELALCQVLKLLVWDII